MKTRLVIAFALACSALALVTAPATATTATTTYATLYGNGGWVTGHGAWLWQGSQVVVSGSVTSGVQVSVNDGTDSFIMLFTPPQGQSLTAGTYTGAVRQGSQQPGQAGIDVFGDGRGCDAEAGAFTVNSIASDLSSVSIDFQADCEGSPAQRSQGEVRFQVDPSTVSLVPVPGTAYFASAWSSTPSTSAVTVHNLGTAPVTVSTAAVTAASDSYSVTSNGCSATLAPGDQCAIGLRFAPPRAGPISGVLTLTDSTNQTYPINLQGTGVTPPPVLTLSSSTAYAYGAHATVTVHLTGIFTNRNVSVLANHAGVSTSLGTKAVGSTGLATFTTTVSTKTTFVATWTDGSTTVQKSRVVTVHAKGVIAQSGAYARSGSYWLFTRGRNITMVATVSPNKAGECVAMTAQYLSASAWHTFKTLPCDALNSASRAGAYLVYSSFGRGHLWRFRMSYAGDSANLSTTSGWLYGRWG